jgi:para-aminobenzoate synthetase component I
MSQPVNRSAQIRLDSRDGGARWNCQPGEPAMALECDGGTGVAQLRDRGGVVRTWAEPLAALDWMAGYFREIGAADARWIGYLSYDLGRWFEKLPARTVDDLRLPLFAFTLHLPGEPDPAWKGSRDKTQFSTTRDATLSSREPQPSLTSNFSRDAYIAAVERARAYIAAGDVFQVNLSQRFTAPLTEAAAQIYERLCAHSPALYGAYLDHGDYALICNSPELFLRVEREDGSDVPRGRRVTTRPIKGTRASGDGMAQQLRDSEKDRAELNMIIDLERNDLGRVCEIGSVRVTQPRVVEAHPTVLHTAATIEGLLREDVTFVDLLRATFPGGSITGAPKIRAMEIIDQLEPHRRGPYCGAIGYLGGDGTIEFNIAIRTMIVRDGVVHIPVGGGIVADSDPAAEYEETLVKARAMFDALGVTTGEETRRQGDTATRRKDNHG